MSNAVNETTWVEQEFGSHPLVKPGLLDFEDATLVEHVAVLHLLNVISNHYRHILPRTKLVFFLARTQKPDAIALHSSRPGHGVAIISHGMMRALAALSARIAILCHGPSNPLVFLNPQSIGKGVKALPSDGLQGFELSDAKRRSCGFEDQSLAELAVALRGDTLMAFFEFLCASLEFVLLHEVAHVGLRHSKARELFSHQQGMMNAFHKYGLLEEGPPDDYFHPMTRIERCFEHQADYWALKLMFRSAPYRPANIALGGQVWAGHVFPAKVPRRLLAFVGAAISFAIATVIQAAEPDNEGEIELRDRGVGVHPLPTIRLSVATDTLLNELSTWGRRIRLSPTLLFDRTHESGLPAVRFISTQLCMSAVRRDWKTAAFQPGKDSPWAMRVLKHNDQRQEILGSTFAKDYLLARELVENVRRL